jgi:hypothetical protein
LSAVHVAPSSEDAAHAKHTHAPNRHIAAKEFAHRRTVELLHLTTFTRTSPAGAAAEQRVSCVGRTSAPATGLPAFAANALTGFDAATNAPVENLGDIKRNM